jgi:integrase
MKEPIRKITLKDGGARYRVVVDVGRKPNGDRAQRTKTFRTHREARAWLTETRQACTTGTYVRPEKVSVAEHLAGWLAGRRKIGPATRRNYSDALRPVRDMLGAMALQNLTRADVEAVVTAMLDGSARRVGTKGKPLSARSVNLTLTVLQAALETAVRDGQLARNPAAYVERAKATSEARTGAAWTPEQVQRFKAVAGRDRLSAAWLLSLYGLRRGEVLGLRWERSERWSWVDLDAGELHIGGPEATRTVVAGTVVLGPPKTKRGERTLPLDTELRAALRALRATESQDRLAAGTAYDAAGFIVCDELGAPVRPEWFSDTFVGIARQAGCPPIRLHDARHTSVTVMRSLGIGDHVVAAWHGHDETVMRATYTHTFTEELRAAAERRAAGL